MIWNKLDNLCEPPFPYLQNNDNNNALRSITRIITIYVNCIWPDTQIKLKKCQLLAVVIKVFRLVNTGKKSHCNPGAYPKG